MRDVRFSNAILGPAIDAGLALLNSGSVTVYTDPRPNSVNEPPGSATQLVSYSLANPAFSPSASGSATAAPVAGATASSGQGHASWFRAFGADGTALLDGRIDSDGTGDLVLSEYEIFTGDAVSLVKWVFVLPPRQ